MLIDPESPMPLYYQIKRELTERIIRGDYSDTGKLPSESQLQAEFEVGRATIRKAIDELAKQKFNTDRDYCEVGCSSD
jgi:GntR family transcriptional regulator